MLWFIILSDLGRGRGRGKPHLARWKRVCSMEVSSPKCTRPPNDYAHVFFFFHEANNNGSALGCFAVVRAKCSQSRDVKRASRCLVSWVLLIITAPLEPRRELTFDLNKSGRTDAVRLARLLLCWLKRMKACLDTAASDRIRLSSGPLHYCSHSNCALFYLFFFIFFGPAYLCGAFSLNIVMPLSF